MQNDHFYHKAKDWDKGTTRVHNTKTISEAILEQFSLHKEMEILDFGVGTGLLGFEIAKHVKKVYGVDTSRGMLEQLQAKNTPELSIEPILRDILQEPLDQKFDGLISSMTLHHIEDLKLFFSTMYDTIEDNGFLAVADLELEDGTFHSDNTGVYHFGFDTRELCEIAMGCGFREVTCQRVHAISKPQREYGVFLLSATK
ncbi:MAG: class I SAM-dependent methyltransferase [Sulfurimonadaceae bacterium]